MRIILNIAYNIYEIIKAKLFKVSYLLFFFSLLMLFPYIYYSIEEKIKDDINKIEQIKSYRNELNWINIKNEFESLVYKYEYLIKIEKNIPENSPIWMMWYQGIKYAPTLVLSCIQSVIVNRAKHHVYIITKSNINKYIKLPSFITEKLKNGTFSITHFSDIVRMALLCKYGGYWIDSTYFITTPLTKINKTFYTLKLEHDYIHRNPFFACKWSGNFIASPKNSFISVYGYLAFLYYWKKYNSLIDYFLLDYIIYIAYNSSSLFKNTVDNIPITCNILSLAKSLNYEYNMFSFNCHINKLKWKYHYKLLKNKKKTNYAYLIENYKFNISTIK